MAEPARADLMHAAGRAADLAGRPFFKMSGSGNDFVVFDGRGEDTSALEAPEMVARICARGTGVGADGLVVLDSAEAAAGRPASGTEVGIRYYNADGSRAELCGNATLCTASLVVQLGMADPGGFSIATDSGSLPARVSDTLPEFDLPPVTDAVATHSAVAREHGELRLGFATAGVPHVVILVPEVTAIDVIGRGQAVRNNPAFPAGTNVNFVARQLDGSWRIRTYERGVEDETLACGTGCVATAVLLRVWDEADPGTDVSLETRSGSILTVRTELRAGSWLASLRGEGRVVFTGELGNL